MSTISGHPRQGRRSAWHAFRRPAKEPALFRFLLGGLAGTLVIMLLMYCVDPVVRGRPIDVGRTLRMALDGPHGTGEIMFHVFNGAILLPLGFAFLSVRLPGWAFVKGLLWGLVLWAAAQGIIIPIMGSGFFGDTAGGLRATISSLGGYLVYGLLQGLIAGSAKKVDAQEES